MNHQNKDDRVIRLEERLSYQQRQLEELNQVIVQQQSEILQLRCDVSVLNNTVRGLLEDRGENLPHERPPHY
jgi:SlyX protein